MPVGNNINFLNNNDIESMEVLKVLCRCHLWYARLNV